MRLTILGMNGPFPAPGGATSGYLLSAGEDEIVLDLGSGTLARLTALTPPEELSALLLSHWHYDHCSDLLPLIFRLAACADKKLHIYAPVDENSLVRQAMQQSGVAVIHDVRPGDAFTVGGVQVQAWAARHPVPAVMYRLTQGGKTFCYTGDTNTVEGLTDFARGADFLLADGLFTEETWAEGKPHLSAAHVAKLAQEAQVKRFVITHLNPGLDPQTLLREARAIRSDAMLAVCGDTYTI
ncbi:MAG: MBL fold metallo-hydrolase [Aristaeellaceae bacterium]